MNRSATRIGHPFMNVAVSAIRIGHPSTFWRAFDAIKDQRDCELGLFFWSTGKVEFGKESLVVHLVTVFTATMYFL